MPIIRRNKRFLGEKVPLVCTMKTICSDRFHHDIFDISHKSDNKISTNQKRPPQSSQNKINLKPCRINTFK